MPISDDSSPFALLLQADIPSGETLYNQLMGEIEPELLAGNLPLLEEKYKTEPPAQAKVRADRYEKAFAEYDKRLKAYLGDLDQRARTYQRMALKSAEEKEREEDDTALHSIETAFSSL